MLSDAWKSWLVWPTPISVCVPCGSRSARLSTSSCRFHASATVPAASHRLPSSDQASFNKHIQLADVFEFIHLLFDYYTRGAKSSFSQADWKRLNCACSSLVVPSVMDVSRSCG